MGLLDTFRRALGLVPPITPREAEPFSLTPRARARLAALPDGHVLNLATRPASGGHVVHAQEGPPLGAVDPELGVAIPPADKLRLAGLRLDWDGHRWATKLSLRVEPQETPNPDGRLYETERFLARGKPRFFTSQGDPEQHPPLAARLLAVSEVRSVLFRDHTVTVERVPGSAWAPIDRGVEAALREHFLLCGAELVEAQRAERDDPFVAEIERVLAEQIAPRIHRDGGDIELVDCRDGVVRVHLVGACRTCPASALTLKVGVENALKQIFPGRIQRVEAL